MLDPITIQFPFRAAKRSLMTAQVADLFGLSEIEAPHIVAENVTLDIQPGDVVLFTGPSGSGKSSLMREAGRQLGAVDVFALILPDVPLIEALTGTLEERLNALAACGLSEARLLLRTPTELSDGQRYRFRIAFALQISPLAPIPSPLLLDEFGAILDRTLAKVLAFNLRKLAARSGVGVLCATTHEDLLEDLNPDVHVKCLGEGHIEVERRAVKKKRISFANEFWLSEGTRCDWPYFARWHYRSHHLAFTRRVMLLWHNAEPVGICVFSAPAASLKLRSQFFGMKNPRSRVALTSLNQQLWLLQRVVIHPTYRGAGIAAAFVRRCCELCPVDWIETLTAMGHANPFFERAGFTKVGVIRKPNSATGSTRDAYGQGDSVTAETQSKSRHSEPIYYVFDNRRRNHPQITPIHTE